MSTIYAQVGQQVSPSTVRYAGGSQPYPTGTNSRGQTTYSDGSVGWTQWSAIGDTNNPSDYSKYIGGSSGGGGSTPTPTTTGSYSGSSSGGSNYWDDVKNEGMLNGTLYRDKNKWLAAGGTIAPAPSNPDDFINKIKAELQAQMDEYTKRSKEFDTNNPFTFDEVLAKASAGERYNPYYDAELSDFLKGIDLKRQSLEGERGLISELNKIGVGQDQRNLQEAIRASEEGFAGIGLYNSGARERATGVEDIKGIEQKNTRALNYGYQQGEIGRGLQATGNQETTGRRENLASRTTDITSDVARQKAEEEARYATEKAQYIGYPYYAKSQTGLDSLLSTAFG